MKIPMYSFGVDYLTRYSDFNPLLLFAQKYEFVPTEHSSWRFSYANAIVLVEEGRGKLLFEGEEHRMQPGSLIFIAAGLPHQWIANKDQSMVHRCAYFDWKYVDRPGFNYQKDYFSYIDQPFDQALTSLPPDLKLNRVMKVNNCSQWLSYYNAFTMPPAFLGLRSPLESLQYNAAFQTFLYRYMSLAVKSDTWWEPRIAQIIKKIESLPLEQSKLDLYEYAKELKLGKSRFHQLFKKETGHTPNEYMQQRRLHYAANDLCTSNLSITEIATKYNFSSIHYFSKSFHNLMGMSPTQFKATYQ